MTGAALRMTWHHFFMAGAVLPTGGLEKSQNALVRGRQLCTQLSIFEGSLAVFVSFLMLSTSKNEEVSQNCFRIAAFLILSSSQTEEVSQHSFVLKPADRQIDRETDRQRDR